MTAPVRITARIPDGTRVKFVDVEGEEFDTVLREVLRQCGYHVNSDAVVRGERPALLPPLAGEAS